MTSVRSDFHPAVGASLIALLAGLWLFLSPWIYSAYGNSNAWSSWIAGALIFVFSLARMYRPAATGLSWLVAILGVWTFISPWICSHDEHPGHVVNTLCMGFIVFCAAIAAANSDRMSHDMTSTA